MTSNARDSIRYRIRRANDTLVEAEAMAGIGHWNACVNRRYYAFFYAVTAVLLQHDHVVSKLTQVRSLLKRHFVGPGTIPPELYNRLFDCRNEGDHADFIEFQVAQVRPWIDQAREFTAHVERLLAEQPPGDQV